MDANSRSTSIKRIFQQFFHYRSRTFHHLAGCNLIGDALWKNVNFSHEMDRGSDASVTDERHAGKQLHSCGRVDGAPLAYLRYLRHSGAQN